MLKLSSYFRGWMGAIWSKQPRFDKTCSKTSHFLGVERWRWLLFFFFFFWGTFTTTYVTWMNATRDRPRLVEAGDSLEMSFVCSSDKKHSAKLFFKYVIVYLFGLFGLLALRNRPSITTLTTVEKNFRLTFVWLFALFAAKWPGPCGSQVLQVLSLLPCRLKRGARNRRPDLVYTRHDYKQFLDNCQKKHSKIVLWCLDFSQNPIWWTQDLKAGLHHVLLCFTEQLFGGGKNRFFFFFFFLWKPLLTELILVKDKILCPRLMRSK